MVKSGRTSLMAWIARPSVAFASVVTAGAVASCAAGGHANPGGSGGTDSGLILGSSSGGLGSSSGGLMLEGGVPVIPCSGPCTDFPSKPVYDSNVPSTAGSWFGSPTNGAQSGGPCLLEPAVGALFPNNWTRPRFQLKGAGSQNLFEIRLHVKGEANDLVVYTSASTWTMPRDMWAMLASHIQDTPITVTVRGLDSTASSPSPALGSSGTFTIAPASAAGAMVYWATAAFDNSAMSTELWGFHVGEDNVVSALQTSQVQQKVRATWGSSLNKQDTAVQCIGCHTSTPDGEAVAFNAQWPWPSAMASLQAQADAAPAGPIPGFLTPAAQSNLSPNLGGAYGTGDVQKYMLGIQTFSKSHFGAGDQIVVTTLGSAWYRTSETDPGSATGVVAKLWWFDLETSSMATDNNGTISVGTGQGEIPRMGDSNSAAAPNWSHDGTKIVYASTDTGAEDGRMGKGASDLAIVPYNNKQGGTVTKVPGASDSAYEEYYPAFSADDSLIAFNRVASGLSMYIQPAAEVYVIPASGGTATRLAANDPVACSGATAGQLQNTWPKWAPVATMAANGKTYHWLIFSSTRAGGGKAQLYMTGVVQDQGGKVETFPAVYLWNQDPMKNNLIPAWDVFKIPPAPPIQ